MSSFHRGKAILAGRATGILPVESCNYAVKSQTLSDKCQKVSTPSIEMLQSKNPDTVWKISLRKTARPTISLSI